MSKEVEDFDFGFSTVSDEELAAREREAEERARKEAELLMAKQQQDATDIISDLSGTAEEYKQRLESLYNTVLPLLANLDKDSDTKSYIYWPDRHVKIKEFKARLAAIVNGR